MVRLIMDKLGKITLGIGDGGNDVPMITTAHVGVGIMGNEGMQAARSADYAIGEYRMLQKLLSVHGRYSNLRITDLIKYSFYKNVAFAFPQIVLAFFSRMSAQVNPSPLRVSTSSCFCDALGFLPGALQPLPAGTTRGL